MTLDRVLPAPARTPTSISQATAVEQARAEAEVKAAVVVAQQCPRNVAQARAQMIESCEQIELAERAFFRYSRGGSQITGPSIHLAREVARCWGNVQYGIAELRRDDVAGESEMLAFAWDVQTNTRSSSTFINPHRRSGKDALVLTDTRDIYENNANAGARRVREAIFAIVPPWFVEQAKATCYGTLDRGTGQPLPERIQRAVEWFAAAEVSKRQLETKIGLRADQWTARDVSTLEVIARSVRNNETTLREEFPSEVTSGIAEALKPQEPAGKPAAAGPAGDSEPSEGAPEPTGAEPAPTEADGSPLLDTSSRLAKAMYAAMRANVAEDQRFEFLSEVTGREITSSKELTEAEARMVLDYLPQQDEEGR